MIRVHIADAMPSERLALRLLLRDLNMEIMGESGDWSTTLAEMPIRLIDILIVEWELLPGVPSAALDELRRACRKELFIIIIGSLKVRQQVVLSAGADGFISKGDLPERVAERLRASAAEIRT